MFRHLRKHVNISGVMIVKLIHNLNICCRQGNEAIPALMNISDINGKRKFPQLNLYLALMLSKS